MARRNPTISDQISSVPKLAGRNSTKYNSTTSDERRNVATTTSNRCRSTYRRRAAIYIPFSNDLIATTVTCSSNIVRQWIWDVKRRYSAEENLTVGLDTEWRPYHKGHTVAVLQLCVGGHCLIYRIFRSRYVPRALADFLADRRNIFIGVAVKNDLEKLHADFQIGDTANHEDLRDMAVRVYKDTTLKNIGLKRLADKVLSVEMEKDKKVTMSVWDGWLTKKQIRYACHDAVASYQIGQALRMKMEEESATSNASTITNTSTSY